MIKDVLVSYFPSLGAPKRYLTALYDTILSKRKTFSQYGEDIKLFDLIKKHNLIQIPYLDIGANHPTTISNTFLLYKNGMNGIIIEPNSELISLHKKFRSKDKQIAIGCGSKNVIAQFYISKTPVISSFKSEAAGDVQKAEFLPIMRLDDIMSGLNIDKISLLSIDVEGLNLDVLEGAEETLKKAKLICIEFDNESERQKIINLLSPNFQLIDTIHCNLIFENIYL